MFITYNNIEKVWLIICILLSSGFLLLTDDKRSGVFLLRELYILFLTAFSFFYFYKRANDDKSYNEYFVLSYVVTFTFLSSLFSYIYYYQPIFYSLLEERRILLFLIYYPIIYSLRRGVVSTEWIVNVIILSFICTSIVGYLYSFNIISDNVDAIRAIDYKDISISNDVRSATRYRIGTEWLLFCFTYSLLLFIRHGNLRSRFIYLFFSIYCVFYLWFVIQTRTTMLLFFLYLIVIFVCFFRRLFFNNIIYIVIFSITITILFFCGVLDEQIDKLIALYKESQANAGFRVRDITKSIIISEIENNYYVGKGSLSLQYNGGFSNVYNEYFYLSDVGIYGIYYRFGLLSLPIIVLFYRTLIKNIIASPRSILWFSSSFCFISYFVLIFYIPVMSNNLVVIGTFLALLESDRSKVKI